MKLQNPDLVHSPVSYCLHRLGAPDGDDGLPLRGSALSLLAPPLLRLLHLSGMLLHLSLLADFLMELVGLEAGCLLVLRCGAGLGPG